MHPNDGRVVSNFIVQALQGKPITIYGDGSQTRSFCYVDDLIEALVRLMRSPAGFTGPVNLGNPEEFTILELARTIIELTGSTSEIVTQELPKDDPERRKPDITLARSDLDWSPQVPLAEGIAKTIDYLRRPVKLHLEERQLTMSEAFTENDDNRDEAAKPGDDEPIRVLVAIASFGTKNLPYLKQVIRQYQGMALDIDIVLNTEAYKAVDPAVEVIVGLPDKNPRSLVFAHREIFASRVDEYDAFIYTEDDIGVQEQHLRAFFALTATSSRMKSPVTCATKSHPTAHVIFLTCTRCSTGGPNPCDNAASTPLLNSRMSTPASTS